MPPGHPGAGAAREGGLTGRNSGAEGCGRSVVCHGYASEDSVAPAVLPPDAREEHLAPPRRFLLVPCGQIALGYERADNVFVVESKE